MAVRSLGQLTLDLVARTGGFVQGMDKAERRTAKWRKQVSRDLKSVGNSFKLAAAAAAAGLGAMVVQTANSAREIRQFAEISDTTTQTFQRMAFGASRFGIQQDKLADILKDTNDRIGDFIQTGGGPMADFFEQIAPKVGVTAEQFARLSGPEALQLYVDSLEKAGVSQKDMVFYMEAIASDASMLMPLLADSGAEMNRLGDEAERTGNVFSEMEFEQLEQIKQGMDELTGAATGMKNQIVLASLPAIQDLVDMLSNPQTLENAKALGNAIVTAMSAAVSAIDTVVGVTGFLAEELAAFVNGPGLHDVVRLEEAVENQEALLDRLMNGPNRPPQSVIDEEIAKLEVLENRLKQGIALQQTLLGAGTSPASSSGGAGGGTTAGGRAATVYDVVPTNEQAAAMNGASVVPTGDQSAAPGLATAPSAGLNLSSITPMSADAFKDGGPASSAKLNAVVQNVSGSAGGGGPHLGTLTLAGKEGGKIDVQANADELRRFVTTLFSDTASSV